MDATARHQLDQAEARCESLTAWLFECDLSYEYATVSDYGQALELIQEQPRAAAHLLCLLAGRLQTELSVRHLQQQVGG